VPLYNWCWSCVLQHCVISQQQTFLAKGCVYWLTISEEIREKISLLEFSKLLFLNPKWRCSCPQKDQALGILCIVSRSSLLLILFDFFLFFLILCSSFSFKFCCPRQHHGWSFLLLLIFWLGTLVNVWHWITPTAWSWWSQWKFYGSWLLPYMVPLEVSEHVYVTVLLKLLLSLFFCFLCSFWLGFPFFPVCWYVVGFEISISLIIRSSLNSIQVDSDF
jgi:hypothetical protein